MDIASGLQLRRAHVKPRAARSNESTHEPRKRFIAPKWSYNGQVQYKPFPLIRALAQYIARDVHYVQDMQHNLPCNARSHAYSVSRSSSIACLIFSDSPSLSGSNSSSIVMS